MTQAALQDLYRELAEATPEARARIVLRLITDYPVLPLALPARGGVYANLNGIDLSRDALKALGVKLDSLVRLTNADLEGAHLVAANLEGVDLSRANLKGAVLWAANLHRTPLEGANLQGASLWGAKLRGANLHGASLEGCRLDGADLRDTIGLSREQVDRAVINDRTKLPYYNHPTRASNKGTANGKEIVNIRIIEEPLTARNFATVVAALTELHTKYWLIQRGRLPDVIRYAQTYDMDLDREANLTIVHVSHNSPLDLNLKVVIPVGKALEETVDAIAQARHRIRRAELENRARELDIEQKEQELQSTVADTEQARQIQMQRELLELKKEELALQLQSLELENRRMNYALELADKVVERLYPGADIRTKAMLAQTLLPQLLLLGSSNGLELGLPISQAQSSERHELDHL